jgi:anti-sigma B factor antagonist
VPLIRQYAPGEPAANGAPLVVEVAHRGAVSTVRLTGEVDLANADQLAATLLELYWDGDRHIDVDASDLDFIDAAGLSALVAVDRRLASSDGHLGLIGAKPSVQRLVCIAGLEHVLHLR